ncbi:efflux RND transporter periplasmic adaptor subunit [Leptospira yasudae]|uniref:HlyD family efflux transporter periplasmic adaptor subunit n=1 Tax=Leptospira yasudae TaxID=2202201 RepID=A0A6N4QFK3_9LEPT|nr:efflux RND transporter periplasmic adaptor subunit [Leptospira yasudae]TGL77657.1 HlyD family efflux transporter periplasmic adaptor subunit [Leptospira yasudae]TGL82728.1 HlyD family efflux transporter periplasmic adaptor subunit [Leptospira yasudae]TGL86116.1 HlyD family efflux transporter periplasmic adaptor subunit [Leptospira yasudae]
MMLKNLFDFFVSVYRKRPRLVLIGAVLLFALAVVFQNWNASRKAQEHWKMEKARSPRVTEAGARIEFPKDHPGLARLVYQKIGKGNAAFSVIASARVIASINTSVNSGEKLILFDSGETTHLYSEYKRTRAVASKAFKDLARVKDMYVNQAATRRDVTEAESNFAVARAESAEAESKLRTIGFNPKELDVVSGSSYWIICDVPESQLSEVENGEEVKIQFSSFPGKIFIGKAEAVGEVIDPVLRAVKVRVTLKNTKERILPGMFARVDFGDPRSSVLAIPNHAIVTVDEKHYVFLKEDDNSFRRTQVVLGSSGEERTIVKEGLSEGDEIVVDGAILLKGISFGF